MSEEIGVWITDSNKGKKYGLPKEAAECPECTDNLVKYSHDHYFCEYCENSYRLEDVAIEVKDEY